MSIDAIGGTKGYATSILGGWNKPEDGGTASAIRGKKPEDNIGALLAGGNVNPPSTNNY